MKKILRFIIFLCIILLRGAAFAQPSPVFTDFPAAEYAVSDNGLPMFSQQFRVGKLASNAPFRIWLEYPEYAPLSADELKRIERNGWKVDTLHITSHLGFSRKEGFLQIDFCPVFLKDGKPQRLLSAKICYTQENPSQLHRKTAATADRWKNHSVLSEGKWTKIRVSQEGIYQYTASQLAAMGFQDPTRVKLYGYGGRPIEEDWDFTSANRTPDDLCEIPLYRKSDGTVLFFAEGVTRTKESGMHFQNPYSTHSCYFLTEGESPMPWTVLTATPDAATPTVSSVAHVAILDNDAFGWYEGGREMYDSYDFAYGNSHTFTLQTPHPATTEATLHIAFSAASSTATTQVDVAIGSTEIGTFHINKYGSAQSAYEMRKSYTTDAIASEKTNVRITTTAGNPARLNYIRILYNRLLNATDAPFSFSPYRSGKVTLQIEGANAHTRLWAIGDADRPAAEIRLNGQEGTAQATVEDGTRRYVLCDVQTTYPTPETVGSVANQDLHATPATDLVIIIPESGKLKGEAERLAEHHRTRRGLRVKVVDAGSLYNEFSSGTPDASAYRRFLKMLYDRADSDHDIPKYLLLFGNSCWDNRMLTEGMKSNDPCDYLLCFEVSDGALNKTSGSFAIGELNSYVTDDFFGWLDDTEGTYYALNKCDIATGRFLCTDENTAKVLVDKSIAYSSNEVCGSWKNRIFVLGDYGNKNLHMEDATPVAEQIEQSTGNRCIVRRVFWDAYERVNTGVGYRFPEVTQMLQEEMQKGALLFNYSGHGSPSQISYAQLLTMADFKISSSGRLPLWIMASCEISPFDALINDIGRTAVTNPTGGAISMICASRSVYSNYNKELSVSINRHLFESDASGASLSMGEALRQAKVDMLDRDGQTSMKDATMNKLKYVLLGDPTLPLTFAKRQVRLDSINGEKVTEGTTLMQLKAGSVARFSGSVLGPDGEVDKSYVGLVTATVADREEEITCHNYDGANKAIVYKDRPNVVYEGSDSIREGHFELILRVPREISYSQSPGRVTFYAVNQDRTLEGNGYSEAFCLDGTDNTSASDSIPPVIKLYLDSADFVTGGITSSHPTLYAEISDDMGISTSTTTPGGGMELFIDDDWNHPIAMAPYFAFDFGSCTQGTVTYPLGEQTLGSHSLTFRVRDLNGLIASSTLHYQVTDADPSRFLVSTTDNPARTQTRFICNLATSDREAGGHIQFEVYNLAGIKVWNSLPIPVLPGQNGTSAQWLLNDHSGAPLPSGLYLYRVVKTVNGKTTESKARKMVIARP